mmetsp:Transcript_39685/g.112590  ORF Transcript_39685/g.112590 Transcript_39685/m.112590 type:complete len:361 (+) Transcript_39685:183-1265(+)|eukprot:CAMPEP_0117666928 /NCGR_PEP_ID=MMETSP0804-20121206/10659_1 /TAXON_ID=1074897 /ORGANISM="Tetraselmis astigmatica, Strain CCMP880" /LENGTH=360 /DNA_ID=CAMNT_0005474549 /DNA_START=512 /DNA_END=1594 /DNA_ORIENTATION=+
MEGEVADGLVMLAVRGTGDKESKGTSLSSYMSHLRSVRFFTPPLDRPLPGLSTTQPLSASFPDSCHHLVLCCAMMCSYGLRLEPHPAAGDQDLEAGISAEDFQEFRRLKRIALIKDNRYCIWENTPTPSGSPERDNPSDEEAATAEDVGVLQVHGEQAAENGGGIVQDEGASAPGEGGTTAGQPAQELEKAAVEEEQSTEYDREEALLFKHYLEEMRAVAEAAERARALAEEESAFVGPQVPTQAKASTNEYGKALLPGEGEAMAAFVQSGKRIPRRGEVGLKADEIQAFEDLGYIMSGSRHSRMNAIRIRKENQIYTAEEKAALAQLNFEEKAKKEQRILADMRKLVDQTVAGENEDKA